MDWAGGALGAAGIVVMNLRVGGKGIWWIVLGIHGIRADMALIETGLTMAILGLILSVWGLVVTVRWKSGAGVLCSVATLIALVGLIMGVPLYGNCLSMYRAYREGMRIMEEQRKGLDGASSSPASTPTTPR